MGGRVKDKQGSYKLAACTHLEHLLEPEKFLLLDLVQLLTLAHLGHDSQGRQFCSFTPGKNSLLLLGKTVLIKVLPHRCHFDSKLHEI